MVTQTLEDRIGTIDANLDERFGAISEAVRALANVVVVKNID